MTNCYRQLIMPFVFQTARKWGAYSWSTLVACAYSPARTAILSSQTDQSSSPPGITRTEILSSQTDQSSSPPGITRVCPIFLEHIGGVRLFSCAHCDTVLTNRSELISTRYLLRVSAPYSWSTLAARSSSPARTAILSSQTDQSLSQPGTNYARLPHIPEAHWWRAPILLRFGPLKSYYSISQLGVYLLRSEAHLCKLA
jgi:hypothetical protein